MKHVARVAVAVIVAGMSLAVGCQYVGGSSRQVESGPYSGPNVGINSFAPQHQIRVTAPTGGWDVGVDEAGESGGRAQVFITATKPAQDQMVMQALQVHEVNSTVDSRRPIDVYVRVVPRGSDPGDFPYRLAERSRE